MPGRNGVLEVGIQRLDVLRPRIVVGGEWHGRVQAMSLGDAVAQSPVKVGQGESADAVTFIRGDVGRVDGSNRSSHPESAGEGGATGNAVARGTVTELRQVRTASDEVRVAHRCKRCLLASTLITDEGDRHGCHK